MSQIYIKEPPTSGKVLLKTTLGDMDIELWSKEAPLACRNFVQLCMEGYYNGVIFHRIVHEFIAQTGDPTGTGEGGESVYGHPFKDEFHSRLKFNRRGLVGMANGGKNDNSSQFFITLNRCDELSNKHTLFGKITGDTLYNMIRLNEISTDKEDHPLDPLPKILKTKILNNPFDDIEPRIDKRKLERKVEKHKSQSKATKNFSLLSFGEEAEDDEEKAEVASKDLKIKSSHDVLLEDPKLSAEPAITPPPIVSNPDEKERKNRKRKRKDNKAPSPSNIHSAEVSNDEENEEEGEDAAFDLRMRQKVAEKMGQWATSWEDEIDMEDDVVAAKTEKLRQESKQIKRELKMATKRREEEARRKLEEARQKEAVPEVVKLMKQEMLEYKKKKSKLKGSDREQQTLELLSKFKSKVSNIRGKVPLSNDESVAKEAESREDTVKEGDNWLSHQLSFKQDEDGVILAKDANIKGEDTYDIFDPRNPMNVRRREEGKTQTQKKRDRGNRT